MWCSFSLSNTDSIVVNLNADSAINTYNQTNHVTLTPDEEVIFRAAVTKKELKHLYIVYNWNKGYNLPPPNIIGSIDDPTHAEFYGSMKAASMMGRRGFDHFLVLEPFQ